MIFQRGSDIKFQTSLEGRITKSKATHLNERIERLPTRSLEVLLGLEHDLVRSRLKRFRQIVRDEVQTPPVGVRDGVSDSEPLSSCMGLVALQGAGSGSEEFDLDTLGRFSDG